jgi:2-dehydro-3-deoxygluconokinase
VNSVFAVTSPDAYDWPVILSAQDWLHVSGTAAAIGEASAAALDRALTAARGARVGVSLDLNYRSRLWSTQQEGEALRPLLDRVDVLLGAGEEIATVLGLSAPAGWSPGHALTATQRVAWMQAARDRFELQAVACTDRSTGLGGGAILTGLLCTAAGTVTSRSHPITDERGRVGTGDAYAAGIIRGILLACSAQDVVEFAAAAAHLKQSVAGDINIASEAEVHNVLAATGAARLRR